MHQFWNDDDSAKNTRSADLWKIMGLQPIDETRKVQKYIDFSLRG